MTRGLHIAFFGSSLVSAYWSGAATYYRGIIARSTHVDTASSFLSRTFIIVSGIAT
jgi:hypothetical protein